MSKATPSQKQTVNITVNGDGTVSADPDPAEMAYGTSDVITWKLKTSGYKFADTDPIQFTPDCNWPGGTPTRDSDTQCTVDDPVSAFPIQGSNPNVYDYTIDVVNTSTGKKHTYDPSIDNESEGKHD